MDSQADNFTNYMDMEHHEPAATWLPTFSLVCSCLIICLCTLGLFGNVLSITIFLQSNFRSLSVNVLLAALSFSDFLMLVFSAPAYSSAPMATYFIHSRFFYHLHTFSTLYFYPLSFIFHCCSIWLLIAVTFERYLAVCRPLLVKIYCTRQRAIIAIVTILALSISFNMSRFWEYTTDEDFSLVVGLYQSPTYRLWYCTIGELALVYVLPLVTVIYLNIRIAIILSKSIQKITATERADRKTSKMLLYIVISFICCYTFSLLLNIAETTKLWDFDTPFGYALSDVNNILVLLNAVTTFLFYFRFSSRYRHAAKLMATRVFCRSRYSWITANYQNLQRLQTLQVTLYGSPGLASAKRRQTTNSVLLSQRSLPETSVEQDRKDKFRVRAMTFSAVDNGNTRSLKSMRNKLVKMSHISLDDTEQTNISVDDSGQLEECNPIQRSKNKSLSNVSEERIPLYQYKSHIVRKKRLYSTNPNNKASTSTLPEYFNKKKQRNPLINEAFQDYQTF